MKLKAVIFDLGGVIFDSPLQLIADYERRAGLPEHLIARIAGNYSGEDGLWHRLERGEVALSEFCARFDEDARSLGEKLSSTEMMREMSDRAQIRPPMLAAIRRLREAGFRVAALTNNWVTDPEYDARLEPLRAEFHVFVESCKVKMRKPDLRIYDLVCQRLGISPHEAVFLDDMGPNLRAGRSLGMTTIKVSDPGPALEELGRITGVALER